MRQILISAHPFGQFETQALEQLQNCGFELVRHALMRRPTQQELRQLLQGVQGVLAGTESFSADLLQNAPELRVISRLGVGTDSIDLEACRKLGIEVLTTPDIASEAVAEYTLGLMIALGRGLVQSHQALRAGCWQRHFGLGLAGTQLGLLGCGRIGQKVAAKAQLLGMNVAVHDPSLNPQTAQELGLKLYPFEDLLASSQILSLHLPLNASSYKLLNARTLALMPSGSYLINTSRGGIVDEEALLAALQSGQLAGAALDVFEQEPYQGPLSGLENVILSAHMAANSRAARIQMEAQATHNLIQFFASASGAGA